MAVATDNLRKLWADFECEEAKMELVPFGPDKIRVAPPATAAWDALATVLMHHRYNIRTADTDSYNCRNIKGTQNKSLHSYGIALDVNWTTNPFINHSGRRKVRFSDKLTQDERAEDVRLGVADTDMMPEMIADVLAIRTVSGKTVFQWGGNFSSVKDAMHFELDVAPADLAAGIDPSSVAGEGGQVGQEPVPPFDVADVVPPTPSSPGVTRLGDPHVVIARRGLKLRGGPGQEFETVRVLPKGTVVNVLSMSGPWALVDLESDGDADGFMHGGFLRSLPIEQRPPTHSAAPSAAPPTPGPVLGGVLERIIVDHVTPMFPATRRANIESNLPFVLSGLRDNGLNDRPMVLMALATIRAETEGFMPISEGQSRFNTTVTPFDKYDAGTSIGRTLGNDRPGDGPRFKGRGYVQLTGRFNYTSIGDQLGIDLAGNPDLANDPQIAGRVLARFLKNKDGRIRAALAGNDLKTARRLVNGGSHGLGRFRDAFERGERNLPA